MTYHLSSKIGGDFRLFYCCIFIHLLLVILVIPFVVIPVFGSIHPQITHEAGKQEGDNGTENGVDRNPFIHIATAFHSVPLPFKIQQYVF